MTPALACTDLTVAYGDVIALRDATVEFEPARIHAVLGQNGAGKTTFARVCAGMIRPASGRLSIAGRDLPTGDVHAARAAGVEIVHQSFALPPQFTVAEALEYGSTRRMPPLFSRVRLERRWAEHLERLDIRVRMNARIRDLPIETQQSIEIARALAGEARLLILDEPTAVLGPQAIEALFERLRNLRRTGITVLIILHKIHEVLAVAETVTVLRAGAVVAAGLTASGLSPAGLAEAIVGSAMIEPAGATQAAHSVETPRYDRSTVLRFAAAVTSPAADGHALDRIDVQVARGEVVGIAGVEGNGQRTLVDTLAGLVPLRSGQLFLAGHDVTHATLLQRRARGLRIIPFERNIEGLSMRSALWQNWSAGMLAAGHVLRFIDPERLRAAARAALERWSVRFGSVNQPASTLSGGNAQKVVLAREINAGASLIVAAQPTRGLDVAAMAFVWDALRAAREGGCGIIVISSDLDELFDISDRIVVMVSGRIAAEFRPPYDLAAVGAAMTAAHK